MSRRVRREAVEDHRTRLQRAVSCVSSGVLTIGQFSRSNAADVRSLQLNGGARVALSGSRLTLRAVQQFLVHQQLTGSTIIVTGYNYTIEHPDQGELLSFQWHPGGDSDVDFPHVHIGPAISRSDTIVRAGNAHRIHVPTGEISLADVMRLAITELEVEPRRDDWESILKQAVQRP